eukprot:PITA_17607
MKPWNPSFNPSTTIITLAPVWVRFPNLPLHLWNFSLLKAIGNAIGKFYYRCPKTEEYARTTYARICVEMDFSAGFPAEINLTSKDYVWNQKLDYESVVFRCRSYFETGHLAKNCPKASQENSARKNHHRSTWWEGAQKEHYTVIKEEYSLKNSESKVDLIDQTSSSTIFKRMNTTDHEAKTPMSQEPEEMKEMQDKGSSKTIEKKKKAATPISPRKTRSETIKN